MSSGALLAPHASAVTPMPDPNAVGYTVYHNDDGTVSRWDPCQPVPYTVNADGGGPTGAADVEAAMAIVRRDSGLNLVNVGTSHVIPQRDYWQGVTALTPRKPIQIAWAMPAGEPSSVGNSDLLDPTSTGNAGVGGAVSFTWSASNGAVPPKFVQQPWQDVAGVVVLNQSVYPTLRPGFAANNFASRGLLLLHEIGHAIGLDHTSYPDQVMNPSLSTMAATSYAAGDLRGLALVGAKAGGLDGKPCGTTTTAPPTTTTTTTAPPVTTTAPPVSTTTAPPVTTVAPSPFSSLQAFFDWLIALILSWFQF